ncbi:MAG: transposase domain-containing protein [Rhodocyclaceae bacterium]|nr:transposase domain-containing protein [Rhodocyclaceae bacterium]MCA3109831.1 transposase domain-containing protein [Rhodocyclaceae bacterium]MCA3113807.1 transposase domain-containing protein [Rhodocyclaceae bacterium]MCA3118344.1 transposase domain-containing protein [Rhodocyclaceae bacterium]MCA3124085.1 transposase domain-containing protein [Rhodocyclaceae bacterium]
MNTCSDSSDPRGERAASVYSLVGTAKLHRLDSQSYLRHVLERVADHPSNGLNELLPWAVADAIGADRPHINRMSFRPSRQ